MFFTVRKFTDKRDIALWKLIQFRIASSYYIHQHCQITVFVCRGTYGKHNLDFKPLYLLTRLENYAFSALKE